MTKTLSSLLVAFFFLSLLCFASVARANMLTNGDFSTGTLDGWDIAGGNVSVSNYSDLNDAYGSIWDDLSPWNSAMDGSFALIDDGGWLGTTLTLGSDPLPYVSFDYAVAWSNPTLFFQPNNVAIAFLIVKAYAHAVNTEIPFSAFPSDGPTGVLTGSYSAKTFEDPRDSFVLSLLNLSYSECIVGIDNVYLSDVPPVPEPSTMLLLGLGLAGLAGARLRLKRR